MISDLCLLQNIANLSNNKLFVILVSVLGIVVLSLIPTQVMAQNNPRVNWYEICKNPIVDMAIAEPCSSLTTNGGYTLTPEGERVLACIGGGAAAVLAGQPQLLTLKNQVGCGSSQSSISSSAPSAADNLIDSRQSDPIGNLIGSLFG